MALISRLKRLIGLDGRGSDGTMVPVEREPTVEDERAVEAPGAESASAPDESTGDRSGADAPVDTIDGIGPAYAERLGAAGVETVGDLAAADASSLAEATDLGEGRLAGWIEAARAA